MAVVDSFVTVNFAKKQIKEFTMKHTSIFSSHPAYELKKFIPDNLLQDLVLELSRFRIF
jgi:hypothetical protein